MKIEMNSNEIRVPAKKMVNLKKWPTPHDIEIVADSRRASLFPAQHACRVNSIHHQAIKCLGNDMVAEAHAFPTA